MRLSLVGVVACVLASSPAHAEGPVRLDVSGDRCDLQPAIEHAVALAGVDPFVADATRVLRIRVSGEASVTATIEVTDPDGTTLGPRVLDAGSCEELTTSLGVVLSTILRSIPPLEDAQPVRTPTATEDVEPALAVHMPARRPHSLALDVIAGVGESRSSNGPHDETAVAIRLRHGPYSLALGTRLQGSASIALALGDARLTTASTAFELAPCGHVRMLVGCVVLEGGWVSGMGTRLVQLSSAHLPIAALGPRLAIERRLLPRLSVRAHLDVRAAVLRARLLVDEMPAWTSARFEAAAGFDVIAQIL